MIRKTKLYKPVGLIEGRIPKQSSSLSLPKSIKGSDSSDMLELAEEEALDCSSCCIILKYSYSVFAAARRALAWDF